MSFPQPRRAVIVRLRNLFQAIPVEPAWNNLLISARVPNTRKPHMIVVTTAGGSAEQGQAVALVQLACWGTTPDEAENLAGKVVDLVTSQKMQNCPEGISFAKVIGMPVAVPEMSGDDVVTLTLSVSLRLL